MEATDPDPCIYPRIILPLTLILKPKTKPYESAITDTYLYISVL